MPRLAAIDVGSNAIRLLMVDVSPTGTLRDTRFQRYAVRLGSDVFARGAIGAQTKRELTRVFDDIHQRMQALDVERYRAVATAAMRDARNGDQVCAALRRRTGIELEIISGPEEARLSRDALVAALGSVPPATLLVDLGGGSLELHRVGAGRGRSLPLGSVRLLETYPQMTRALGTAELGRVRTSVRDDLRRRLRPAEASLGVGTGGNLDALCRLAARQHGLFPGIDLRRLAGIARRVAATPPEQRVRVFGLRPDRADILLPAALVILAVCELHGMRRFIVPGTGLRRTILARLADDMPEDLAVHRALTRLARDPRRRQRISRVAQRLFALLAPMHGLWPPARRPLAVAALLGDIGAVVDPGSATPHTAYLLEHMATLDLDDRTRSLAACAAAEAAGADPRAYRNLVAPEDRRVADLLGALLRLAEKLVSAGVGDVSIDLTTTPACIDAGLGRPLRAPVVRRLSQLLGASVRVR